MRTVTVFFPQSSEACTIEENLPAQIAKRTRFLIGSMNSSMQIDELNETECRAVLARASLARLGCCLDDQPYVVPVFIACEGDHIYVFSTFGKKIKWMRANPKVCVQVDESKGQSDWASVIVYGEYQELPEPQFTDERDHARRLLEKRHQWWLNALAERRNQLSDQEIKPIFFRIRAQSMTGLRATPGGA